MNECQYIVAYKIATIDRQNFENFNILHAFLSLVVAKLSDLKNSPVFRPTLYFYSSLHTNLHD